MARSPPLPSVQAFPETEVGKKVLSVRERLEMHRANPTCNGCHGVLDPLGFALENFDVTGAWRTKASSIATTASFAVRVRNKATRPSPPGRAERPG